MTDGIGTSSYQYYPAGALGAGRVETKQGPRSHDTISYAYDADMRLTGRMVDGATETFSYDAINRETGDTNPLGAFTTSYLGETGQPTEEDIAGVPYRVRYDYESYVYDPADNLTSIVQGDTTTSISVNDVNEIQAAGSNSHIYDADGNVLDDGTHTYTWDAENRLIRITDKATGHVSTFSYDGWSHRLTDTETDTGATPVVTDYLWCGNSLCEKRDALGNALARYYPQGELQGSQALYYAQDQVGSVVALVDGSGSIAGRVSYDSYGHTISSSGTLPDFRYAQLYAHDASGLELATYRAYDSGVGRWLKRDPLAESGGVNLFAYVDSVGIPLTPELNTYLYARAKPLRYIDPTGLWYIDINLTGGRGGWGGTGGVEIGPSGVYVYGGGGIGAGAGASATLNSGDPSAGWSSNVTVSGGTGTWGGQVTGSVDSNGQGSVNVGGGWGVGAGIATTVTYTYPIWQPNEPKHHVHKAKGTCE